MFTTRKSQKARAFFSEQQRKNSRIVGASRNYRNTSTEKAVLESEVGMRARNGVFTRGDRRGYRLV